LPSLIPDAIGRTTRIVAAAAAAVDRMFSSSSCGTCVDLTDPVDPESIITPSS
jgi:hypothetical protein